MPDKSHTWSDPSKRGEGIGVSQDALFALIGDDADIMRKVRLMVNMMLENAFKVLLEGSITERTAMSRAMMPAIVKLMAGQDDGGVGQLRTEMQSMFLEMAKDPAPFPRPASES